MPSCDYFDKRTAGTASASTFLKIFKGGGCNCKNKKGVELIKRWVFVLITITLILILLTAQIIIVKKASSFEVETDAVFARKAIPSGAVITEDMLEVKKIRISYAHRLSLRSIADAVGKKAKVDIESGEMLLSSKIGTIDEMEQIYMEEESNRLFTVEFKPDQANGWWLLVGQRVDIIFVPNDASKFSITENTEIPVRKLENIRIAALIDEQGRLLRNEKRDSLPKYVCFEVTEKQAEFLAFAKTNGRIELASRREE